MLLRIQPYDVTVTYKPGAKMTFADYLSRVQPSSGNTIELEHMIHGIIENSDTMMMLRI